MKFGPALSLPAAMLLALTSAAPATAQQTPPVSELSLRPGDAVRVQLRDEPQLAGEFTIAEDGRALLPILGPVHVTGEPFVRVRERIAAAYARELASPDCIITPILRIAVLGEVKQPGLFPVDPTRSLADVIAGAGGFAPAARRGEVLIRRGGELLLVELGSVESARPGLLRSGDQVVVPRQSWLREHMTLLVASSASVITAVLTSLILRS